MARRPWNQYDAELQDTVQGERLKSIKKTCLYCGGQTVARSGVCSYCNDLPALDLSEAMQRAHEDDGL